VWNRLRPPYPPGQQAPLLWSASLRGTGRDGLPQLRRGGPHAAALVTRGPLAPPEVTDLVGNVSGGRRPGDGFTSSPGNRRQPALPGNWPIPLCLAAGCSHRMSRLFRRPGPDGGSSVSAGRVISARLASLSRVASLRAYDGRRCLVRSFSVSDLKRRNRCSYAERSGRPSPKPSPRRSGPRRYPLRMRFRHA